ncbi:MAG TPA: DUF2071 domain-containing protein [Solirubrobacter sp.]|nr:DUF2071 domain-containing protein [Solirubrobacter sp.]
MTASRVIAQARATRAVAHRPWPLPDRPWLMGQTWEDLLFMHWRVPEAELRRVVPEQLPIDAFDGGAWLGVTPFEVRALRLRRLPPLARFPELNVRTYATVGGRAGIFFFSLDAARRDAVLGARLAYRLPYFHARMAIAREQGTIRYRSRRPGAEFAAAYEPCGAARAPAPGSLEHFLTERYCLYTVDRGRVLRADIHHAPWPLQPARADVAVNTMAPVALRGEPLLHFARRQDVVIWPLSAVR